jgi:glycerol-3-phosphate acyltransferase PlsY
VLRTLGRNAFVAVLFLDGLKAYVAVLATWYVFGSHDLQVASGLAAVLGHDFPVYIGFRGGRGVAASFGVYAALALEVGYTKAIFGAFATAFVVVQHAGNIKRLIQGKEPKIGEGGARRAPRPM